MLRLLVISISLALSSAVIATTSTPNDRVVLPSTVVPTHYDIDLVPDAERLTFSGVAKISVDVRQRTREIELNAVDLGFDKVTLDDRGAAPRIAFDTNQQTATFIFADPIAAGPHVLTIAYRGKINRHAAGIFALDYATPQGNKRALFTQFENSDARRFAPTWDEPARKATFTLTATVPAAQMAVSNMPQASSERLPNNLKRVTFMMSPKMSCYLLFFGAGDFERMARAVNGVDVGVVVKRGDVDKGRFALDAAADLLTYYQEYFGVKYPLPKLDLIAAPGASQFFGAMENWGAILYFEKDILVDPKFSTQRDSRYVYEVVAHEMAHQWFGDLVTMAWWDDLWLNEGFASWMEVKATDHFHPEWSLWLDAQNEKESAMRTDARRGTHAIIQPIRDVLQANQAFDEITYEKGEAVIRMLESYVGKDAFRDGVRRYLKAHAYGNTVSDDLWAELDQVSTAGISDIAHDFTRQAGVPLVRVVQSSHGVLLSQDRFSVDGSTHDSTRWHIPIASLALSSGEAYHDVLSGAAPLARNAAGSDVVINAGQSGYFRTLYAPELMAPLVGDFRRLSSADELGLINDSSALGYAGYEPLSDFLALAGHAQPDMDPAVLRTIVSRLVDLDFLYQDMPEQASFRAFGRRTLEPLLSSVGWNARPNEAQSLPLLRDTVLSALSEFEDHAVIDKAREYFTDYLRDPSSLSVELRGSVLAIVAEHADASTWDRLHELAKTAPSMLEKEQLYSLLGSARDRDLALRALRLVLTDEAIVTTRPEIVNSVAHHYPDLAFSFANDHLEQMLAMLEPDSRNEFLPQLASFSSDATMIPKLRAYVTAHVPSDARQRATKAEAQIAYKAQVRERRLAEVTKWLQAHPG